MDTLWRLPEGRGFSPAEIAAPALCRSRAPRSLQPQAARGAGRWNNQEGLVTAGLKPRPSRPAVTNAVGGGLACPEKSASGGVRSETYPKGRGQACL